MPNDAAAGGDAAATAAGDDSPPLTFGAVIASSPVQQKIDVTQIPTVTITHEQVYGPVEYKAVGEDGSHLLLQSSTDKGLSKQPGLTIYSGLIPLLSRAAGNPTGPLQQGQCITPGVMVSYDTTRK